MVYVSDGGCVVKSVNIILHFVGELSVFSLLLLQSELYENHYCVQRYLFVKSKSKISNSNFDITSLIWTYRSMADQRFIKCLAYSLNCLGDSWDNEC